MITIGIDPVIFSIGHFSIRWYSVMIAVAIVVASIVGMRETRRRGIPEDDVYSLLTWGIIAGIIGARLFHVIDKLDYYLQNPAAILAFQEGGLAIFGAIICGAAVAVLYCTRRKISVGALLDSAAPALILGQAIGRVGCMVNGDVFGTPTDLPWGVAYTHPNSLAPQLGVPGHPAAGYELIWDLIVFGILWRIRKRALPGGMLFVAYIGLYSIGRFVITFYREDLIVMAGLTQAQLIALGGAFVASWMAVYLVRVQQVRQHTAQQGL